MQVELTEEEIEFIERMLRRELKYVKQGDLKVYTHIVEFFKNLLLKLKKENIRTWGDRN